MVSSQKYLDYVLEQLNGLEEITYRKMMGEYILYYQGKIVGGIYDDRLLVKPVASAITYMKEPVYEYPYTGAKEMLLVKEVDDSSFIKGLFKVMVDELSMTKKKKKNILRNYGFCCNSFFIFVKKRCNYDKIFTRERWVIP